MTEAEGRIEDRANAIIRAVLRDGGMGREACVLDLSSRGLMATADPAPERGTIVEVVVGRHSLVGQVQWAEERRFGVKLRERIDVITVLGNEAGPTALKIARAQRGKPSAAARLALTRQLVRGFVFGLGIAAAATAALAAAQVVRESLAPLDQVSGVLAGNSVRKEPAR